MGCCSSSLFKIQCGDEFVGRCWDFIAKRAYICELKDNLKDLQTEKEKLSDLRGDVERMIINELVVESQVPRDLVRGWVSRVDTKIAEVDTLLNKGEEEKQKLCLCGCCSMNCISSYRFGKSVAKRLKEVIDLRDDGGFKEVAMKEPAKQLEANLRALKTARDELLALMESTRDRIRSDEEPEKKPLPQVINWISKAEMAITEAHNLLVNGEQETKQLDLGDISKLMFAAKVAKNLEDVVSLKANGVFKEVVLRVPKEPDYISKLRTNLDDLKTTKEELWALKEEVMHRFIFSQGPQKKPLPRVQQWCSRVENTISDADELIRDGPQQIEKLSRKDYSNYKKFVEEVAKTLKDAVAQKVEGDLNFEQMVQGALPVPVIERNYKYPLGIENSLDEAWRCLEREDVSIVGIYGIGGVGKTTLLNQINSDLLRERRGFDIVIWVLVSRDAKSENIQKVIWKRIGISDEEWLKKSIRDKADDIFGVLHTKKFVLLLDDIWQRLDFEEIGIPIPNIKNGSKIVFTTRSEVVCGKMEAQKIKVKPLNWDNSWELFREKVVYIAEDVILLAEEVAKKCCGLPIALITLGCAMNGRKESEEWNLALEVLNSTYDSQGMELEIFQEMEVEVFKPLKLSYDYLPNDTVKSCFLYCSLFPDDFKIFKDDLVHYWICEELVCTRNEGYSIIGTLILASLLEVEEGSKYVKMHDVIRDMALWIACKFDKEKENFFVKAGGRLIKAPEVGKWEGAKRMSLMGNSLKEMRDVPTCPHLLTLLLCDNPELHFTEGFFFRSMNVLTVLDLSKTGISMLPMEISNLVSLQYLNLSGTMIKQLPVELMKLVRLKYLNLEITGSLSVIPRTVISSLSSLQVLRMFACGHGAPETVENNILSDDIMMIEELNGLKGLNELSITIRNASSLQRFFSTPTLLNSTRAVFLGWFRDDLLSIDDITSLANLKNLEKIVINLHPNLEKLNVDGLSMNLRMIRFDSLREVNILHCYRLIDLTWLVLAPNLRFLNVFFNENMEEIISGQNLSEVRLNLFSNLQVLKLGILPKLQSIYQSALSFPSLKRIEVYKCPNLKKLPLNCSSAKGCDVEIVADEDWWKDVEWEDNDTKDTFRSRFISRFQDQSMSSVSHLLSF